MSLWDRPTNDPYVWINNKNSCLWPSMQPPNKHVYREMCRNVITRVSLPLHCVFCAFLYIQTVAYNAHTHTLTRFTDTKEKRERKKQIKTQLTESDNLFFAPGICREIFVFSCASSFCLSVVRFRFQFNLGQPTKLMLIGVLHMGVFNVHACPCGRHFAYTDMYTSAGECAIAH